jgi:HPt (histidine-containing phosphotransfer) domain-containing protein
LLDEIQRLAGAAPDAARKAEAAAAPPRSAAPAVVNAETLSHLEELGSSIAFIEKLVHVFLSDSGAMLERVEKVLAGRDYHEFRSLLHAMKGSSASIGTDRLTQLCARISKLSDAELRLQAHRLARSLGDEVATARAELERYVRERKQSAG